MSLLQREHNSQLEAFEPGNNSDPPVPKRNKTKPKWLPQGLPGRQTSPSLVRTVLISPLALATTRTGENLPRKHRANVP